ncbi:uncharacterized protein LOC143335906 [Chaetodon auriga]|uniref:uncharacterized protein LOC143335906 n=1 Tax=Chaetodon auriga TaxID=39042 RepID=UPI0040328874
MVEFRRIVLSLLVMLLLNFAAAEVKYSLLGNEVTLPCVNVADDQDKCNRITWLLMDSGHQLTLIGNGQFTEAKAGRLSVTANCSLVIKKVTAEDRGNYICRQLKSGKHKDTQVYLSVIHMMEQKTNDKVTLSCSVSVHPQCGHTVRWLYDGKDVDKDNMRTSECSATVTFLTSTSKSRDLFQCKVINNYSNKVQLFTFGHQPSGDDAVTAAIKPRQTSATGNKWTSVTLSRPEGTNKTSSTNNDDGPQRKGWWWFVFVSVGAAALFIIIVAVITWRAKGSKTQKDGNMADPEDGVFSYASVSYTRRTTGEAQVRGDNDGDDDEGDAVTYSAVRASSSSAGASTDLSNFNAADNNPADKRDVNL